MVVVIQTGVTSHAQRGLPIDKIPGQTCARKSSSCKLIPTASHNKRQRREQTCPITTPGVISITLSDRLTCQAVNIVNGNIY